MTVHDYTVAVDFRLSAPEYDFWVDVRARRINDRWIAVADIADEPVLGTGMTARDAIQESLRSLGTTAGAAFLADPLLARALDR